MGCYLLVVLRVVLDTSVLTAASRSRRRASSSAGGAQGPLDPARHTELLEYEEALKRPEQREVSKLSLTDVARCWACWRSRSSRSRCFCGGARNSVIRHELVPEAARRQWPRRRPRHLQCKGLPGCRTPFRGPDRAACGPAGGAEIVSKATYPLGRCGAGERDRISWPPIGQKLLRSEQKVNAGRSGFPTDDRARGWLPDKDAGLDGARERLAAGDLAVGAGLAQRVIQQPNSRLARWR